MASMEETHPAGVDDMISLKELTEESIMENLKLRYEKRTVYAVLKKYVGKKLVDEPPHIFAIAEAAYFNLKSDKKNQSIIISGESGAGKSESTKLILQYLTAANSNQCGESWIEQQILEANTVLESFGNAKTVRNNNSSRFGKFIQVHVNKNFSIIGASIVNYLLEKSRVSKQALEERNYHIFYELIQGASEEEKIKYKLSDISTYDYLTQSGCLEIDGVSDKKQFEKLKMALTVLNMPPGDMEAMFLTLSAILMIGNIKFNFDTNNDKISISNVEVVATIAELLSINKEKLCEALCFKKLTIRGEVTMVPIKPAQAFDNRNSISKAIYDNIFQRAVDFINKSLTSKEKVSNFVGVLDIFGFEDFKINSFEQFCINYTNEKLQQFFNQCIFKLEQTEYDKENIVWKKITFTDNQVCLDLIENKPAGIISVLDEETKFPKGSDESWLSKLDQNFSKHAYYVKPKISKGVFGIKHYAGEISWVSNIFVSNLVPEEPSAGNKGRSAPTGAKTTAATYFKNQLISLVTTLAATTPHYIRCIKPNSQKEAFIFYEEMVLCQLRYSGMLDTIRIRKAGFSSRFLFELFVKRFKCLVPSGMKIGTDSYEILCKGILTSANMSSDIWQLGKTKVFLKDEAIILIQKEADKILTMKVLLIQKFMHGYVYRKKYCLKKKSAMVIQKYLKGFLCKRIYIRKRKAAIKIQSVTRGWFARDFFAQLKKETSIKISENYCEDIQSTTIIKNEKNSLSDRKKSVTPENVQNKSKEENEMDSMFAFIGDFDHTKRKPKIFGAEDLILMAENLTSEIDALFDAQNIEDSNDVDQTGIFDQEELQKLPSSESLVSQQEHKLMHSLKELTQSSEYLKKGMKSNPLMKKGAVYEQFVEEKIDPNSSELSLQTFAARYFDSQLMKHDVKQSKSNSKTNPNKIEELLRYTKLPITSNILKILEAKKVESIFSCIQQLIKIGIENVELRDEIYIQLCRQVTVPIKDVPKTWDLMVLNGWLVISLVSSSFRPSKALFKYLYAFVLRTIEQYKYSENSHIKKYIVAVEENLGKQSALNGPRIHPPSIAQIQAQKEGSAVVCPFYFMDGLNKPLPLRASSTASNIIKDLVRHIELQDFSGWSLFETGGHTDRLIKSGEYINDILASWEMRKIEGSVSSSPTSNAGLTGLFGGSPTSGSLFSSLSSFKKKKDSASLSTNNSQTNMFPAPEMKIVFRKRVFKNLHETVFDPVEANLLYSQSVDATKKGIIIPSFETSLKLAGIQLFIECGELEKSLMEKKILEGLSNLISSKYLINREATVVVALILQEYESNFMHPTKELKFLYLELIQKEKRYGSTIFPVKYRGFWSHVENILLSISEPGIEFLHPKSKDSILSFSYANVTSYEIEITNVISISVLSKDQDDDEKKAIDTYQFNSLQVKEKVPEVNWVLLNMEIVKARENLLKNSILHISQNSFASKTPLVTVNNSSSKELATNRNLAKLTNIETTASNSSLNEIVNSYDRWNFTKTTLDHPLLNYDSPFEDIEWALSTHTFFYSYAGVFALPVIGKDTYKVDNEKVIEKIAERCLQVQSLTNELYLQLIQCTSEHPDPDCRQVLQFWKLMAVYCGLLVPSGDVLNYLKIHLKRYCHPEVNGKTTNRNEEAIFAQYCQKVLLKAVTSTPRKLPPSKEEIISSMKCSSMKIRIYFLDGQFRAVSLTPTTTVGEILDYLEEKIKLKGVKGFSLYEHFCEHENSLDRNEKMADIITKWQNFDFEKDDLNVTTSYKQKEEKVKIYYKKKLFFTGAYQVPCSEMEENLLRAIYDFSKGMYPLSDEQEIYICALLCQQTYGDFSDATKDAVIETLKRLPPQKAIRKNIEADITKCYKTLKGKLYDEVGKMIMEVFKSWDLYGSTIFEVQQHYSTEIPRVCWLSVSIEGVHILEKNGRTPKVTYTYPDILTFVPSTTGILLHTESLTSELKSFIENQGTKYVFSTKKGHQIAQLMKDYINQKSLQKKM
ncbi:cytochrome c oxidase subunit 1 [Clydaea vesicula]|uniref:Cytochrome c oxidase subunit 1 n=1 Tax=Clydaea vesicula TaxID=447962 RepID=A0AAD5U6E7_9FUNG|nr:cytochrome c oxidase subunit 1 [Clydaea vesicula]